MSDKITKVSPDLYVLYHIYYNHGYDFFTFSELREELEGRLDGRKVLSCITSLMQWGVLNTEYGEVGENRAGRLHRLDSKYATPYMFKTRPINLEEVEIVEG